MIAEGITLTLSFYMLRDNKLLLRREAGRAKRALSSQHQVQVEIESLFDGIDFSEPLIRALFEKLNDFFWATSLGLGVPIISMGFHGYVVQPTELRLHQVNSTIITMLLALVLLKMLAFNETKFLVS